MYIVVDYNLEEVCKFVDEADAKEYCNNHNYGLSYECEMVDYYDDEAVMEYVDKKTGECFVGIESVVNYVKTRYPSKKIFEVVEARWFYPAVVQ